MTLNKFNIDQGFWKSYDVLSTLRVTAVCFGPSLQNSVLPALLRGKRGVHGGKTGRLTTRRLFVGLRLAHGSRETSRHHGLKGLPVDILPSKKEAGLTACSRTCGLNSGPWWYFFLGGRAGFSSLKEQGY
jgi:hypothetical protein